MRTSASSASKKSVREEALKSAVGGRPSRKPEFCERGLVGIKFKRGQTKVLFLGVERSYERSSLTSDTC